MRTGPRSYVIQIHYMILDMYLGKGRSKKEAWENALENIMKQ